MSFVPWLRKMDFRPVHLDASFLIKALTSRSDLVKLHNLAESERPIRMSSVAWYEFSRGPRTPNQLAVARSFLLGDGIVPFDELLAEAAAELFRALGSPRRRSADIAIAVTAISQGAALVTLNPADFQDIPGLALEP
jgi:predicted nucleic acid-binding protein